MGVQLIPQPYPLSKTGNSNFEAGGLSRFN